jgi:hypothetical protein
MTKLTRVLLAIVALLALGLTACGGDDDDDAELGADVEADADADADVDLEDLEDLDEAAGALGLDEGCIAAVQAFGLIGAGASSAFGGDEGAFDEYAEAFERFADGAPDEIQADVRIVAEAYQTYFAALAEADYDPSSGESPSEEQQAAIEEATDAIDDEEVTEASDNISAWMDEHCQAGE